MLNAEQETQRQGHTQLIPEQVIVAIAELEPALFTEALTKLGLDQQQRFSEIQSRIGAYKNRDNQMGLSEETRWLLHNSLIEAHQQGRRLIEPDDFLRVYFAGKQRVRERLRRLFRGRKS